MRPDTDINENVQYVLHNSLPACGYLVTLPDDDWRFTPAHATATQYNSVADALRALQRITLRRGTVFMGDMTIQRVATVQTVTREATVLK